MPRFTYIVKDKDGRKITSSTEAKDEESLVLKLQTQGLYVIKISPELPANLRTKVSKTDASVQVFTHGRVKLADLVLFARQMATMLGSGVNLLKGIDIILKQVSSKSLSNILKVARDDLARGASFSNALAKHPRTFNQFWVSLVEVGEASGNLPIVLSSMAKFLEDKAEFRNKIVSSVIYPILLFVICIGALSFFGFKIMPKFAEIFDSFNAKLPPITQAVLNAFYFLKTKLLFIIFALFGVYFLISRYARTDIGKRQLESILYRLPLAGDFFKMLTIEKFTSQMSILVDSGVPILYALEISQRAVDSKTMEGVVGAIKSSAREGQLIADAMARSGFFSPMVVQMVMVGEETGELGNMLKKVAEYYESYIATFVQRFTTLFEPLMLVFMGVVVGIIVIAMFLPIFSIARLGGAH